jgi:hypothetical protein
MTVIVQRFLERFKSVGCAVLLGRIANPERCGMKKRIAIALACIVVSFNSLFAQSDYAGIVNTNVLIMITNGWCAYTPGYTDSSLAVATNYSADSVEYMIERGTLTNVINRLVKDGHVCTVVGHIRKCGCGIIAATHYTRCSNVICAICGKPQSEWK